MSSKTIKSWILKACDDQKNGIHTEQSPAKLKAHDATNIICRLQNNGYILVKLVINSWKHLVTRKMKFRQPQVQQIVRYFCRISMRDKKWTSHKGKKRANLKRQVRKQRSNINCAWHKPISIVQALLTSPIK